MKLDQDMKHDRYFPSYKLLAKAVKEIRGPDGKLQALTLPLPILVAILRDTFTAKGFDEQDYLSRYPDVRESVSAGRVDSGLEHFVRVGFFEGRLANYVPPEEDWYRERNVDVLAAIERGRFKNAEAHYLASGAGEGRAPTPELVDVVHEWRAVIARSEDASRTAS